MDEYKVESSCPRCGSDNLRVYPDGTFQCMVCGFTNRMFNESE